MVKNFDSNIILDKAAERLNANCHTKCWKKSKHFHATVISISIHLQITNSVWLFNRLSQHDVILIQQDLIQYDQTKCLIV